jgi:hypothetical protein
MADYHRWSGEERRLEERRQILERRHKERMAAKERRANDRRLAQVCYVCHTEFTPKTKDGPLICPACEGDSLRGSARHRPRFSGVF